MSSSSQKADQYGEIRGEYVEDWYCCGKNLDGTQGIRHLMKGTGKRGQPECKIHNHSACWGDNNGCIKWKNGQERAWPEVCFSLTGLSPPEETPLTCDLYQFRTPTSSLGRLLLIRPQTRPRLVQSPRAKTPPQQAVETVCLLLCGAERLLPHSRTRDKADSLHQGNMQLTTVRTDDNDACDDLRDFRACE